jgi:hypothetical protein
MPNFMMPMVQQGQQQRPAGRRAGPGGMQQPMPMGQQQVTCFISLTPSAYPLYFCFVWIYIDAT